MTVDPWSAEPIYQQLAAILRAKIERGEIAPGDPLPSEAQLQQEHGVSRGTVRQAVKALRESGHVVTLPGRGSFVPPKPR